MDRWITRKQVEALTLLSRSTIYRLMRAGRFPLPKKVSDRAVRWSESEVREWMAAKPEARGEAA